MYDAYAETFSRSRTNHPWKEIDMILEDLRRKKALSVLDVGCGNGRLLDEARKQWIEFPHYLGIDSSALMIHEARKSHPKRDFRVLPMEAIDTLEDSYDVIILLASFHHLKTWDERINVLGQTRDRLSRHGRVYLTNWNLLDQSRYSGAHTGNGDFSIKIGQYARYYHGFTITELEILYREAGFTILENRISESGRNIWSVLEGNTETIQY